MARQILLLLVLCLLCLSTPAAARLGRRKQHFWGFPAWWWELQWGPRHEHYYRQRYGDLEGGYGYGYPDPSESPEIPTPTPDIPSPTPALSAPTPVLPPPIAPTTPGTPDVPAPGTPTTPQPPEQACAGLGTAGQYLYVTAGDQDKASPDGIAVFQFKRDCSDYGSLVTRTSLGSTGNEPRLIAVDATDKNFVVSGFASFLTGQTASQNDTFFFNIDNPASPRLVKTSVGQEAFLPIDFVPLRNGGFLGTRLASGTGDSPGAVVEFDSSFNYKSEYGTDAENFNPNGLAVLESAGLAISTDFINPISSIAPPVGPSGDALTLRNTLRVWDLSGPTLVNTVSVPEAGAGLYAIKFIPNDAQNRAFMTGTFSGKIYLVTPDTSAFSATVSTALDFATALNITQSGPTSFDLVPKYQIGFVALTLPGLLVQFSYRDPANLQVMQVFPVGEGTNPGFVKVFSQDDRFVATTYFLDLNFPGANPAFSGLSTPFGKIRLGGSKQVHVFQFSPMGFQPDPAWRVPDFNVLFEESGVATPHGAAFYPS